MAGNNDYAVDRTFVDVVEECLGFPFDSHHFREISFSEAKELAKKLGDFYDTFQLPTRALDELCPYLSPTYINNHSLGLSYSNDPAHFHGGQYVFNSGSVLQLLPQLKSFLLYSHRIYIYDALPGLLDFIRFGASDRLPAINHLLREYASFSRLIRNKIVVPISDEVFRLQHLTMHALDEMEIDEIDGIVRNSRFLSHGKNSLAVSNLIGPIVKKEWYLRQFLNGKFDLYFPMPIYVDVYCGLLRGLQQKFSSTEIIEPFNAGTVGDLSGIDHNKISIDDIILIRNEGVFNEFRDFMRVVLQEIAAEDGRFSDFDTQFASTVREQMREQRNTVKKFTDKSSLLRDAFDQSEKILIGAAFGSVSGFIAGSYKVAGAGAAIAGAKSVYDLIRTAAARLPGADGRLSLRNHFLAIQPPDRRES